MLKQRLSQKQLQKLSPQQIQLMKLLQVPTAALEDRIKEELEANPALEEGKEGKEEEIPGFEKKKEEKEKTEEVAEVGQQEEIDVSEYLLDDDAMGNYRYSSGNYNNDEEDKAIPIAVEKTFHEELERQLGMLKMDDRSLAIGKQLVGSIDDDGYLRRELDSIIDDLAFAQNIETTEEELAKMLLRIQAFEPAGVGARSLQECLLIQLYKLKKAKDVEDYDVPIKIIESYFDQFAKKHYDKLKKQLSIDSEQLKAAIETILKLNPKPGSAYVDSSELKKQYIIPDFIIRNNNGELVLSLNSRNAPDLRISEGYREMLSAYNKGDKKDKDQKKAIIFIKQKIDGAKWFIDAIRQRQQTMLNSMNTIMDYQYEYFLTGDETKLKPMILKDIADITGLDISTVSRVSNSKYCQTEFGTFKLKSFFSESLSTDTGEEVSTREVKRILQDMVDEETKTKPLSDQKLTEMLKEKGYNIARRTVAKYREQLSIPVARLRKQL